MRQKIGFVFAMIGFILALYLFFGLLKFVPLLNYQILGETALRFIAQSAISCFLVAAWGYWKI
jgi:hypothetical protein